MATWATYWSGSTATDAEGELIDHIASDQFGSAGVSKGDILYVITYVGGHLHIVTSLVVEHLVAGAQAERILKRKDLWQAESHAIARSDSIRHATMSARLTSSQTGKMVFLNKDGEEVAPARNRFGEIDHQTFRSTRRINAPTAAMLKKVLAGSR